MKILCPSVKGLRKRMKICEEFSKEYGVEYNPTKTVFIRFSKKEGPTPGGCFNKHDGRPTGRRTILQWTNNMGGWSVARSDSPSCLLKQAPEIHLSGTPLKWVKSVKDLGIFVDSDLRETTEIRHKRGDLLVRVNIP